MTEEKISARTGESFHIRHRNFFVGLFLLIPLVIIPLVFMFALAKSEIFEKWMYLYVMFDAGTGLKNGNEVTIRGIRVGNVEKVFLDKNGFVNVQFKIKQSYAPLVKKDSKALLKQTNLVMGDWQIELTAGSPGAESVRNFDMLQPDLPLNMGEIVNQALAMFNQIQDILRTVQEGKGSVGRILMNDTLALLLEQTVRDARRLVGGANRTLGGLDQTMGTLDTTLQSYAVVGGNVGGLLDSLAGVVAGVNGLMGQVAPILKGFQTLPAEVNKTMQGLQRDLRETETLIKAVQRHPLIRKEVKQVVEDSTKESKRR
jgi:phospholipid/cholesterol/gamma-HCH transport system substrate-binding protein